MRTNLARMLALLTVSAAAQQRGPVTPANAVPRFDLSLGYNRVQANAPPGDCNCFGLNGGFAEAGYHFTNLFSAVAEGTVGQADNISALGQSLTLTTVMAGPRVTLTGHKLVPYSQVLFGLGHGGDSYFPSHASSSTSASSFALSAGGGLDINLSRRFAVRAPEVQYMRTTFPNGSSDVQQHLMIGGGLVIKFGGHKEPPSAPTTTVGVSTRNDIHFTCSENVSHLQQGEMLEIIGSTMTEPDQLSVTYSWTPSVGTIEGSGREVRLDTSGVAPGTYRVKGHAAAIADRPLGADCELTFAVTSSYEVNKAPEPPPSSARDGEAEETKEKAFHENVQDALFDYDSAVIRPDAQEAIGHAALYLQDHPALRVQVGGFADERGTVEYNVALGQQRAQAARNALIDKGVSPSRIEIISYGKASQVCTAANEGCWQKNRRAAFSLHP